MAVVIRQGPTGRDRLFRPGQALPAQAAPDPDPFVWTELAKAYAASAPYGHEPFAVGNGFRPTPCVSGTGYHCVKEANAGRTDPRKPAAVLYENGPTGRALIAVEWIVQAEDGVGKQRCVQPHASRGHVPGEPGPLTDATGPGSLKGTGAHRSHTAGQRTNTPAWPARSRKYCGATPSTSVTATPTPIAVIVSGDGTATVGPSGRGSLKNISTMTRM